MRALVLWADGRSTNLGVQALGAGTEALIHQAWPDARVDFHSFGSRAPSLPLGSIRALLRAGLAGRRELLRWFRQYDLIVDTRAGDSFSDIYGLWRLHIMSLVAEYAVESGVPVVLGPQTIGPFTKLRSRLEARWCLHRYRAVLVRDSISMGVANDLGRRPDAQVPDVVFALDQPPRSAGQYDVLLNVSGLLWEPNPHVNSALYRQRMTNLYSALREQGRDIALLAHVLDSPSLDNDVPAIQELARLTRAESLVIPDDLQSVREVISGAQLVIGARMHACLNALSCGTPTIALAYSRKFTPLLMDVGWKSVVDLRTSGDPVGTALQFVGDSTLKSTSAAVRHECREAHFETIDILKAAAS